MSTIAQVILTSSPSKHAGIGQNVEERVPLRWYRNGVGGLQVLVIVVYGFDELRIGLSHVLIGVAADDPPPLLR
jgi:hypothetical protein